MQIDDPAGQHLRVERLMRLSPGRALYLVNNQGPKWSRRKCWACGNKYTPNLAKCCDYCLTPLRDLRFMMTARWQAEGFAAFTELAKLRIDHFGFLPPQAVMFRGDTMLSVYHYNDERLLLDQPAPMPPDQLLTVAHGLGDVLHHLHQHGVVLAPFGPENILLAPDGSARLFDPDVTEVVRPSKLFDHPEWPTRRDFQNLGELLERLVAPENTSLRGFFARLADGDVDGYRAFDKAMEQIILNGGARPVPSSASAFSDVGLVRAQNEDTWAWAQLSPRHQLYILADGMGGHEAGEVASALAVQAVLQSLSGLSATANTKAVQAAVGVAMEKANSDVYAFRLERRIAMGTTLVVAVVVDQRELVIANAGDSRTYLFRLGKLHQLSKDHSVAQALVDDGRITPAQARTHPRGNILTTTVGGDPELEEFELSCHPVKPGDRLLLCSDGLWNEVDDERLAALLGAHPDRDQATQHLLREAYWNGGRDNTTLVLVDIH